MSDTDLTGPSTYVHPETGAAERAEFVGAPADRVLAILHLPHRPTRRLLVVCSPTESELLTNYRKEVLLARALAEAGTAVVRFQYRGAGNSDRLPPDQAVSITTMVEDALRAFRWASGSVAPDRVAVLGTRLGGLVAASLARRLDAGALVLWEPVLDAARYYRDLRRALSVAQARAGEAAPSVAAAGGPQGWFDVMGYRIMQQTIDSARNANLRAELGDKPRAMLLVQLSKQRRDGLAPGYEQLIASLSDWPVQTEVIGRASEWWFVPDRWELEERRQETRRLVPRTVEWIGQHIEGSA